jgi:hypothetical protein
VTPKRLYEVATKARELVDRDGWQKWDPGSTHGPKCALGHLRQASGLDVVCDLLPTDFYDTAGFVASGGVNHLTAWNDAPERTIDDVRSAFDALASLALSEMAVEP